MDEVQKKEIQERLEALRKERDLFVIQANNRVSYLDGQIDMLVMLLAPPVALDEPAERVEGKETPEPTH